MQGVAPSVDAYVHAECHRALHSYKTFHARALEREAALKCRVENLDRSLAEERAQCAHLREELERAKALIALLRKMIFGRQSEQSQPSASQTDPCSQQQEGEASSGQGDASGNGKGKRGQRQGSRGHGRRCHPNLPSEEVQHELPPDQCRCPKCGAPFEKFPGTEDSEEIHWDILLRLLRRLHKRARYKPTCRCEAVPGIVTAPAPPKLFPKGKFSVGFWVNVLTEKYLLQRPLYRVLWLLAANGLKVSQGTLTGGLQSLLPLLLPLYSAILEHNRNASHWHMDETHWMIYAEAEGKQGHRWWLWVVVTRDTVAFLIEPSRSAEVPSRHLGEGAQGIVSSDRLMSYISMAANSNGRIVVAFCWVHQRRDFIRVRDGYGRLAAWAQGWVSRVAELYRLNAQRLAVRANPAAFAAQDGLLRQALSAMAEARDRELADSALHPAQRKALVSLRVHWQGLCVFVDHPDVPMDNSESERRLRNAVVGRKNYYGSGAIWSGTLAAVCFTLMQTALKNGLHPQKFLHAYLQACAENGGRPPQDARRWLPWGLSPEQKAAWALPP